MRISTLILGLAVSCVVARSADARVVYLKAGPTISESKKAPPTSPMPNIEVVGAYDGDNDTVILEIRACGRTFHFGVPKARYKDEAVYDAILDYIKAECGSK